MTLAILKFVHAVLGLVAIGATVMVLYGVVAGKLTVRRTVVFLECFLTTSATGLLFPFHHFLFTHWATMLGVYVSGIAVLALCKHHLAGSWRLIFAVTIVILLCLNVLVSIAHIFKFMPIFEALAPAQSKLLFFVTEVIAMLPFAALCLITANRLRERTINSLKPR